MHKNYVLGYTVRPAVIGCRWRAFGRYRRNGHLPIVRVGWCFFESTAMARAIEASATIDREWRQIHGDDR